jgi:hypothetical protein
MTPGASHNTSSIWRLRRLLSRLALVSVTVLLVAGLGLAVAGRPASVGVLGLACAILVGIPILNVLAVLAVELRRGDWRFAAATGVVLVLIAYTVVTRILMRQ